MTGFELRLWRRGQGWTQQLAAEAFGVSTRTWIRYEQNSPPRMVDLAILALSLMVRKLNKQFNELVMTFSDGEYR